MLDPKRTAIVFTANTKQVAEANLFIESLRDPARGNFQGDLWVISTDLSNRCMNVLDSLNIKHHVNPMMSLLEWGPWRQIAEVQPEFLAMPEAEKKKNRGACQYKAFLAYRNKRMSKLIIIDWVKKFGERYDYMVLCDNDIFVQRDIHELFETSYADNLETIHYWQEERENLPGSWIWKKNFNYGRFHVVKDLDWGSHEINIGFIIGKPQNIKWLFDQVRKQFFNLNRELFIRHEWHDQDLCRLTRAKMPERFSLFSEGQVLHLCNGGETLLEEPSPLQFRHSKTNEKPYVVHFAGGAWKKYPSVKSSYEVAPDHWFFTKELEPSYDPLRRNSLDIFNHPTKYCNKKNIYQRDIARARWRACNQSKPKLLLHGWLSLRTHVSFVDVLDPLIGGSSDAYNIVVLNGNATDEDWNCRGITEDIPNILATLTALIKDTSLVQQFGIHYPWVSHETLIDTIKSLRYEYDCSEAEALAATNLLYSYFYNALLYYNPDIVILQGYYGPGPRLVRSICKDLGIPTCLFEWHVLPGALTFDFSGHMAESWPAKESGFFNALPITNKDIISAKSYLETARVNYYSRNKTNKLPDSHIEYLQLLQKNKKRVILYIESNSAYSGNIAATALEAKMHAPRFADDQEGYAAVLAFVQSHPECHIIYRPHPISLTRGMKTVIDKSCTTVITDGSLDELLSFCDISATLLSAGGYLSLIQGIPFVMFGVNQINDSGAAYVVDDNFSLDEALENALTFGFTANQQDAFNRHVARLIRYTAYSTDASLPIERSVKAASEDILSIYYGSAEEYQMISQKAYQSQLKKREPLASDTPIVSVVLPVYNTEKYLVECLNSILQQTLTDIELICVNNGSSDSSQEILEYYATRDPRICVHQFHENVGPSAARNWGIRNAKGKYLYLMDSDDHIDSSALEVLAAACEEFDADLMYFFFREIHATYGYFRPRFLSYLNYLPTEKVFKLKQEHYGLFIQYPFPWAKLMRRDFVCNNSLLFDESYLHFEDNPHNLQTLLAAKNPYVYNERFYNLRIREGSNAHASEPQLDAVGAMNEILDMTGRYAEFQPYYVPYKMHVLSFAWDRSQENLHKDYFEKQKSLYRASDSLFFDNDEMASFLGIPSKKYRDRTKHMLEVSWEEYSAKVKSTPKPVQPKKTTSQPKKAGILRRNLKKIPFLRKFVRRLRKFLRKL
jgi:glycosyltransferase involved in cell wall biosynthesis